jgi:hypothetical protein
MKERKNRAKKIRGVKKVCMLICGVPLRRIVARMDDCIAEFKVEEDCRKDG